MNPTLRRFGKIYKAHKISYSEKRRSIFSERGATSGQNKPRGTKRRGSLLCRDENPALLFFAIIYIARPRHSTQGGRYVLSLPSPFVERGRWTRSGRMRIV